MAKLLAYTVTSNLDKEGIKNAVLNNLKTAEKTAGTDAFALTFDNNTKKLYMIFSEQMVSKNPNMDEHIVEIKPDIEAAALRSLLDGVYAGKTEIEQLRQAIAALDGVGDGGVIGEPAQRTYDKFVVLAFHGQSNMVGYDESPLTVFDEPKFKNRLFQIEHDSGNFSPLDYGAISAQNLKTTNGAMTGNTPNGMPPKTHDGCKGIHLPLANLVASAIPDDYGVIVVSGAYGGKTVAQLSKGGSYYDRWIQNIKTALSRNDGNKLLALFWIQGEFDSDSASFSKAAYKNSFTNLINDVKNDLEEVKSKTIHGTSVDASMWYAIEFPVYYKNVRNGNGRLCLEAQKEVVGVSNYVEIPDSTPYNATKYTSGNMNAHYGQDAFRKIIAPRVFARLCANGVLQTNIFDADTVITEVDTSEIENKVQSLESRNTALQSYVEQLHIVQ